MLEIVILPSFSIFKYYNFVRVCSSDLFYFTCVMHVTGYYFIGCHCSIPRRTFQRRRRQWYWAARKRAARDRDQTANGCQQKYYAGKRNQGGQPKNGWTMLVKTWKQRSWIYNKKRMETSSSLIIIEMMEESRRRRLMSKCNFVIQRRWNPEVLDSTGAEKSMKILQKAG